MKRSFKFHWQADMTAAESARQVLPRLLRPFFEAGRRAAAPGASASQMHRFRLLTKQLRYTLEIFRPCYGKEFDEAVRLLRSLQQHLGDLNDCTTTCALVTGRRVSPVQREAIRQRLDRAEAAAASAFRQHWRMAFVGRARQQWWNALLGGRSAARPPLPDGRGSAAIVSSSKRA